MSKYREPQSIFDMAVISLCIVVIVVSIILLFAQMVRVYPMAPVETDLWTPAHRQAMQKYGAGNVP